MYKCLIFIQPILLVFAQQSYIRRIRGRTAHVISLDLRMSLVSMVPCTLFQKRLQDPERDHFCSKFRMPI